VKVDEPKLDESAG